MRDPNTLHCLLDDDADAARSSRRSRRRSLAISISLQALFLSALIVAPMIATGALPLTTNPPVIVYHGNPGEYRPPREPAGDRRGDTVRSTRPTYNNITEPNVIPNRIPVIEDAPEVGSGAGGNAPTCPTCREDGLIPLTLGAGQEVRGPAPPPAENRPTPVTRPVRLSEPIQEAKLVHRVDPTYPVLCKQIRQEGRVVLRAIISTDGTMRELSFVSGPPCFMQHTLNAISQWRYRPTVLNGQPVEVETNITVIYTLNR